jgi:NADH-quinone oxidoreductase subunit L
MATISAMRSMSDKTIRLLPICVKSFTVRLKWPCILSLPCLSFWRSQACALSWFFYMKRPDIPAAIKERFAGIYTLLDNKYYFDRFNDWFFAGGARGASRFLWKFGDVNLIDGVLVNGTARLVGRFAGILRNMQTGYVYHYAFAMITGVFVLLTVRTWFE